MVSLGMAQRLVSNVYAIARRYVPPNKSLIYLQTTIPIPKIVAGLNRDSTKGKVCHIACGLAHTILCTTGFVLLH